jgi:hypothetical protein
MPEEAKKSESEILFPEIEVEGIKIKPWSFGQLADVSPALRRMSAEAGLAGVTIENIESRPMDIGLIMMAEAPEVVARTIGMPLVDVRAWPIEKSVPVFMAIVMQNLERIKNFFGPAMSILSKMKKGETD